MNLRELSIEDLQCLREALAVIADVALLLEKEGLPVVVSMTEEDTVLRAPSVFGVQDAPNIELVEPCSPSEVVAAEMLPMVGPEFMRAGGLAVDPAKDIPAVVVATEPEPEPEPEPTAADGGKKGQGRYSVRERGKDGLIRGPYSEDEKQKLHDMLSAGATFVAAAKALERSAGAVRQYAFNQGWKSKGRAPVKVKRKQTKTSGVEEVPKRAPANAGPRKPSGAVAHAAPETARPQPDDEHARPSSVEGGSEISPSGLSGQARELFTYVTKTVPPKPPFDCELDLELVEGLASGRKLGELALDLDIDAAALKARYAELSQPIRNNRNDVQIDGQAALLKALRLIVIQSRGGAQ